MFLHLYRLESPSPEMHCAKFGWNWLSGSWEDEFYILSIYFRYFVIISPWKRAGPLIWTNLNHLHTWMHCAKFGWNWASGSGQEVFFNIVNFFLLFRNYLSLIKGGALIWTKLNTLHPRMLCARLGWNWQSGSGEENFLKVFWLFVRKKRQEKGLTLHLNKIESSSPKDALCQVLLKLAKCFWRRRLNCEKFTDRRTDGQTAKQTTDDRRSEKLSWAFSSDELKKET